MDQELHGRRAAQTADGKALLSLVESCWVALAVAGIENGVDPGTAEAVARLAVEALVFGEMCRRRGVDPQVAGAALGGDRDWLGAEPVLDQSVGRAPMEQVCAALRGAAAAVGLPMAPAELLGRVHQHLLGRRLQRRGSKGWRSAATSAARRAAGVYYTPAPICAYVVAQALEGVSCVPRPPTILDPACGSAWFLLSACRAIAGRQSQAGLPYHPCLLAESLYGVDIDPQAVLAARRALWLELVTPPAGNIISPRDRGIEASGDGTKLAAILADHLRCGDVLTEPVFAATRFDVVLGNPPYRRELGNRPVMERLAQSPLGRKYRAPRMDLWYYFVHRSLELLRRGGRLSLVVGAYWTAGRGAEKLISGLQQAAHIDEIACLDCDGLFPGVAGRQMILTVSNATGTHPTRIKRLAEPPAQGTLGPWVVCEKRPAELFRAGRIDLEPSDDAVLRAIERWPPLAQLGEVRQGIAENPAAVTAKTNRLYGGRWRVGAGVFALNAREVAGLDLPCPERALLRPYHDLCDLGRYRIADDPSLTLIYATADTWPDGNGFPTLRGHLQRFRPILEARRETRLGRRAWWQLHWPREERLWQSPKLVVVQMAARPAAAAAMRPVYVPFSTNVFVPGAKLREELDYLAALLNSRVLWKWYRHYAKRRGVGLEINGHVLARTPIRRIDFNDPAERARHGRLVELAGAMRTAPNEGIDAEIDALVAELYGVKVEPC